MWNLRKMLVAAAAILLAGCVEETTVNAAPPQKGSAVMATNDVTKAALKTNPEDTSVGEKPIAKTELATLAGGCFWGMEEILRKIPGVISTRVGYTGGTTKNPNYKLICTGTTGHAEAIEITFDPTKITYEQVLGYFFRMHDPTTLNRQHNDIGTQYRSAIFYHDDDQKKVAEAVKEKFRKSGRFKKPIVTEITKASAFYEGEDYHQKYLVKNPGGYNCHYLQPE
jgi:peptide-methionine (S)-S-oxide reductase